MILNSGWGYWDITNLPYGGDFRRTRENVTVDVLSHPDPSQPKAVTPGCKYPDECTVRFHDGRIAIVRVASLSDCASA